MTMNSRKKNKLERKLRRQAMREAARAGQTATVAQSVPAGEAPADQETAPEAPATPHMLPAAAQPESRVQKRIHRVLESSAADLEEADLAILNELVEAAREGIALHKAEVRERLAALQRGQPITTRWQVAPGVFEKLAAKVLRIVEIKLRHRRANGPARLAS